MLVQMRWNADRTQKPFDQEFGESLVSVSAEGLTQVMLKVCVLSTRQTDRPPSERPTWAELAIAKAPKPRPVGPVPGWIFGTWWSER